MNFSEWLHKKLEWDISPEILTKLEWIEVHFDFKEQLLEYKRWLLKLLWDNPKYANHPIVLSEIEKQNLRLAKVYNYSYDTQRTKSEIFWASANREDYKRKYRSVS